MTNKQKNIPLKIILADDESDDCLFFAKALQESSIDTKLTAVHDGDELMTYLFDNLTQLPDVIFLDLNMPRKNGFECLTEIKQDEKLKHIPVILFSTSYPRDLNYESNLISSLLKMGAQDYIRKLNDFNQLKNSIIGVLNDVQDKN